MTEKVTISSKVYQDGMWTADCKIETSTGTRVGPHSVTLPETATDDELKAALLGLYDTPQAE